MHHYPFHVGDYLLATAHLPPMADLAYRRLLDLYFTEERPIPNKPKWVANRIRLDSEEPIIGFVLREYFKLEGAGPNALWHHKRADEEIAKYRKKVEIAQKNGQGGGRKPISVPKSDTDRKLTRTRTRTNKSPLPPEGVVAFDEFWNLHPRKVGKPKAEQAFAAALVRGAKPEDILSGFRRHIPVWSAKKAEGEGDKIPHPSTWLNRDGWTDEVMPDGQKPQGGGTVVPLRQHETAEDTARMLAEKDKGTKPLPAHIRQQLADAVRGKGLQ